LLRPGKGPAVEAADVGVAKLSLNQSRGSVGGHGARLERNPKVQPFLVSQDGVVREFFGPGAGLQRLLEAGVPR
jgi:hypothetical protein